jgi:hypothetical protein
MSVLRFLMSVLRFLMSVLSGLVRRIKISGGIIKAMMDIMHLPRMPFSMHPVVDIAPSVGKERNKAYLCFIHNPEDEGKTMRVCEYDTLEELEQLANEFGYGPWIPITPDTNYQMWDEHHNKDDHRFLDVTMVSYIEKPAWAELLRTKYILNPKNFRVRRPLRCVTIPRRSWCECLLSCCTGMLKGVKD